MKEPTPPPPPPKLSKKEHRARVRLVIETYEWLIHCRARAGDLEKCQQMAARMMAKAAENPTDYGRWKSVQVTPPESIM